MKTKKNAAKKASRKPAKAKKPTPKAKPAQKNAKTPNAKKAEEMPPQNALVAFPATFTTPGGCEFVITQESITLTQGLHELIFSPARAYQLRHDLTEIDGHALETPIPAGTLVLERGSIARLVPAEYADVIAAILAAKSAKRNGGAKR